MAEFSSNGKGNTALGFGIAGTALGLLGNHLTGLLTGTPANCGCNENHPVNRYELGKEQKIAALETENSLLKANIYTDQKLADVFERLDRRIRVNADAIAAQAVYNATNTATISCLQGQVAQLQGMTKMIIPASNVCPQPMPLYNTFVAPTTDTTTTT